jgi:two-component system, OmpR family, sensor histidine kinase KdpD
VNATTVGFAYLLLVLVVAANWGFVESVICALAATIGYNFFFLPPVGTLTIADPQNWIALASFLTTALIASRLSDRARQRALEAIERQRDLERLYTFSRAILLINEDEPFPKRLAQKLAEVFELEAVVLYDRRGDAFHRAGPADAPNLDHEIARVANGAKPSGAAGCIVTAVRLGAEPIAGLALAGASMSEPVVQGVANLVAIGLERARTQDLAHQVAAARQSEQLRTTLIDAMAHEFKTPLTSIRAATTSLRSDPDQPAAIRTELVTIADEEADHLRQLIDDTVELARLDTTHIEIQAEQGDLASVVRREAAATHAEDNGRTIQIACDAELEPVAFDHRLIRLAIRQLLENALKYSPTGSPINVTLAQTADTVMVEVTNGGAGIPMSEQSRVFDRFFRGAASRQQVPGTGLGLSIAHSIATAHRGSLTLASRPGSTTFTLALPRTAGAAR